MSQLLKLFSFTAEQARAMAAEQSVTDAPLVVDGVTIIPISRLSCGFTGGGSDLSAQKKADGLLGGAGVKITKTPLSFLAVCNGQVQIFHVSPDAPEQSGFLSSLLPLVTQWKATLAEKPSDG